MPRLKTTICALALLALAGAAALGLSSTRDAHAYGKADQPVAQITFSGNCDTPTPGACDIVGGTGGIWLWIELDAGGTGDVAGAGCGHTVGGPRGGAGSIKGEVTWSLTGDPFAAGPYFFSQFDPSGSYYLVTIPDGEQFVFPATVGHYSAKFGAGFQAQLQIAP